MWSDFILEELRHTLVRRGFTSLTSAERLISTMKRAFPESMVAGFDHLIDSMTNHPGDRHVLAAAVSSETSVLVTFNLRHFRQAHEDWGVLPLSPDEFLLGLFLLYPTRVGEIIIEQASALHLRPRTPADVLNTLELHAPAFANAVRLHLDRQ